MPTSAVIAIPTFAGAAAMGKTRVPTRRQTRDAVLKEFNHRCAICGADRPQLHHIDEDPSNNDPANLIPLCPNCHLTDQHNPTQPIDPKKLSLFRRYKDPTILTPQFHPLWLRLRFLDEIGEFEVAETQKAALDLIAFVQVLEMGAYYFKPLTELLLMPQSPSIYGLGGGDPFESTRLAQEQLDYETEYLRQISSATGKVIDLVIEMLRFQKWGHPPVNLHRTLQPSSRLPGQS
jgi:hypothetical protein